MTILDTILSSVFDRSVRVRTVVRALLRSRLRHSVKTLANLAFRFERRTCPSLDGKVKLTSPVMKRADWSDTVSIIFILLLEVSLNE